VISFELAAWFSTSGTNYDSSRAGIWLSTSGWFLIGQFFILPVALLYAAAFAATASFISRRLAQIAAPILSIGIILTACVSSLPEARFQQIVGREVAAKAALRRLTTFDSFNDGITSVGEFRASTEVMNLLVKVRGLDKWNDRHENIFVAFFPKLYGYVPYADAHGQFAYDVEEQMVYFVVRSRPLRER
jgi:hypothetical protein